MKKIYYYWCINHQTNKIEIVHCENLETIPNVSDFYTSIKECQANQPTFRSVHSV